MKLRQPTDFLILEALDEHGRNVAANLTHHIAKSRKNINTRLPVLADHGLVRKIGPAERSGLYELTRDGRVALMYRDQYGEVDDFERLLEDTEPPEVATADPAVALARGVAEPAVEEDGDGSTG
ncbi:MAG TPA: ArsR family transcriptional regulator [Natrialbaceae archaeon]|nr:ArsR family transcriptional regulator [Natrialbaceae archaeon]